MILSHTHKFIFFCNGKTGTTSIEEVLRPLQEGAEYDIGMHGLFVPKHIPPAVLRGLLPDAVWRDYFKIVFVRNPWDWFVSNWFYNAGLHKQYLATRHASLKDRLRRRAVGGVTDAKVERALLMFSRHSDQDVFGVDDVEFLFDYMQQFRGLPGSDGCYQSNYVFDVDGNQLVDFVGRYESLEADFERMRTRIGVDLTLPHLNRTQRRDYSSHFTPDSSRRVGELWATDVQTFGYTFD